MDPVNSGLSRRLWAYLTVLGAAGLVILSWMVPEQPAPKTTPAQPIQPIQQMSYSRCRAETVTVSYGTRSVGNDTPGEDTPGDDCAG